MFPLYLPPSVSFNTVLFLLGAVINMLGLSFSKNLC